MMQFDYRDFILPDGKTRIARPMIECAMINPKTHKGLLVAGLIDSGSDSTLVAREVAELLGFGIDTKKMKETMGIGGSINTVRENVTLLFRETEKRHILENVPIDIDVSSSSESTAGSIEVIFGRRGIFTEFDIEFKEREQKILFRR